MKHYLLYFSVIYILLNIVVFRANATATPDSVYTLKHVLKIHLAFPDSALNLLDAMEARNIEKPYLINAQRGIIYAGKGQQRLAQNYAQKAYQNDSLRRNPQYYLQTMSCIAGAYQRLGNYKQSTVYLTEGIMAAREANNKQLEANFLFMVGENYYALNQKREAYNYFEQAIRLLENEEAFKVKPYLSYFYGELTSYLTLEQRYEEALAVCTKREELIHLMQKQDGIPLGYIDQQLAYLYIKQASLYAMAGKTKEAAYYFARFSTTGYSEAPAAHQYVLTYQLAMKQYRKVVDYYKKTSLLNQSADTISRDFIEKLSTISEACQGLNDFQKALWYQKRIQVVKDSLDIRDKEGMTLELAAIYQLKEKEWYIQQKDELLHTSFIIQTLLACAFIFALTSLLLVIRHMNVVKKKNVALANQISTLVSYEEEINKLHQQRVQTEKTDRDTSVYNNLFCKMERLIKGEKLYLNPELSRQDMLERLSIDKNRFAQMLQENINMSFSQYLTNLRLKHALTEFKLHPNYTIQAISEESGFATTRHFQRLFKAEFGMPPSEYKRIMQEKQQEKGGMD